MPFQLGIAQSDLVNANGRKQQLEGELAAVRAELRDHKQHLHDAISRTAELQRQLQDANAEKSRLTDRIVGLEKVVVIVKVISEGWKKRGLRRVENIVIAII